jgi:hypothetical protein
MTEQDFLTDEIVLAYINEGRTTMNEPDVNLILALAAIIREVDDWHSLGAAALAEAILKHPLITVQIAGAMQPHHD